jgi:cbb3-type cytochrome oxidase subunit 3
VTRTKSLTIVLYTLVGVGVGWLLQTALAATGRALVEPQLTLAFTLAAIGVVVILFARPVRRAVRDRRTHRVDPFYATRVLVLAKASSIAGSLLSGLLIAVVAYLLSRGVIGGAGSVFASVAGVVGAVVFLVCGLVAENMCIVPPDDDDDHKGDENPVTVRHR